jgi:lipoate-protein ligase A
VDTNFRSGAEPPSVIDVDLGGKRASGLALSSANRRAHALPEHWGVLRTAPATGGWNMALDLALLERARRSHEGVWRCYAWSSPTISFGRNERVAGRFDADSVTRAGLAAVRRPTGGRALLHHREVTYSATLPLDDSIGWREAYAGINDILIAALRALGVNASLCTYASSPAVRPDGPLCFEAPAIGEIAVGQAKLVGSAIWRERGAYLQHGSILLHDDQRLLLDASRPAAAAKASSALAPAASLHTLCTAANRPAPSWSDVADALETALATQTIIRPLPLDEALVEATERTASHFSDAAWLWRR